MLLQDFHSAAQGSPFSDKTVVVGTVGDHIEEEWEDNQLCASFTVTTFGESREINVQIHCDLDQQEKPKIEPGTNLRMWGILDEEENLLQLAGWERDDAREFRALVCGGRDFNDRRMLTRALDLIQPDVIIHGAARGADRLAGEYAQENGIPCERFPADWDRHGRSAGPHPLPDTKLEIPSRFRSDLPFPFSTPLENAWRHLPAPDPSDSICYIK